MDTRRRCKSVLALAACAIALLAGPAAAAAGQPIYKCAGRDGVTYTHVPCSSRTVKPLPPRNSSRSAVPPQNRAKAMNRARLSPQDRAECRGLDTTLRELQAIVKAKGEAVTPDDERPLVKARLRYNALRC